MEINVEKSKAMKILKLPFPTQNMIVQPENVE
jgi:hypothetical protein